MYAFYADHFVLPLPETHRFPMSKYSLLRARLLEQGILEPQVLHEAPAASDEQLLRVHTAEYLKRVKQGGLTKQETRRIGFPWSLEMVERSRRSTGATIAAAHAALTTRVGINLAGGTHHSFADCGEGYCVFNDVACASRDLQQTVGLGQVLVIDVDVHQGNGTAAIFEKDPSVFTFSIHGAKNFPLKKTISDLDVPLDDNTEDDEYLQRLTAGLEQAFARCEPEFVFYVAGADPYHEDRFGRMKLSKDGLRKRDQLVLSACASRNLPVTVVMAGGYAPNVEDIVDIHAATIATAVEFAGAPK
ncbi:histone deacetylase family protein [Rubinisphaera brasiliensis]|uniref:Histone deacetylase n=1 Tax=Rubinisphaera brasiliensis (strain ATCC 49424 / DSM 5305 / JCM 21570 / IAM 15109 / NBRC 103401 / IFAM 1448) TaxID=756272 RepID=F0SLM8_RUBBR|nr:histone deacetylase [Rubinisphaera brasiliensis]ADY57711.1 Histone deacetylase [Rubinisphaera brasiliensis DSM 5305]